MKGVSTVIEWHDEQASPRDRKAALGQVLRHRILTMKLAPGSTLDELAITEEFGLSRPPVRELMHQMSAEGYIELQANRAPRVASMDYKRLRDYFPAAPLVFISTVKLAAEHATRAGVEHLKAIHDSFERL
ncbi:GntR family transcriptional regulator [Caballeronia hypogeia]|uniref:GntR family transcriptional regulator n=1 Tax=Caballeronia hypogeia TaxID=1777140 RepID=UPI001E414948|nr:GntR family transcriptional regulator [Caballeronia hypogeia]